MPILLALAAASLSAPVGSGRGCGLTEADLAANARLSFVEFDVLGATPSTARQLSDRKCFAAAARATEHYLIYGPLAAPDRQNLLTWHLGQNLAAAGEERRAADVVATTRRPVGESGDLDWNGYVTGTWAFLVKDRPLLEASIAQLGRAPQKSNAKNMAMLQRLLRCFKSSYAKAYYGTACATR